MKKLKREDMAIRLLGKDESVPYDLLLDADPSRELVDAYLAVAEVYIACVEERVTATYVLCPINSVTVEIKNIAVKDECQGRGIGTIMLQDAIQKAKDNGYEDVIIGTSNASIGQLYLYQKAGFEMTAININFFTENYPGSLFENGLPVRHRIVLAKHLK
jgi:aminoglycoside 6'-N-acetyltransferase I